MSEKIFRASNNIAIDEYAPGMLDLGETTLSEPAVQALREYFQAERDEHLGRWRDPKNPGMVVYPAADDRVCVLKETSGEVDYWARWEIWLLAHTPEKITGPTFVGAAKRYFEAHPETVSRPWENAQEGEIWALTIGDEERLYRRGRNGLYSIEHGAPLSHSPAKPTAGARISPEPEGNTNND